MNTTLSFLTAFFLVFSFALPAQAQDLTSDADTEVVDQEVEEKKEESSRQDPVKEAQRKIDEVRKDVIDQRSKLIDGFQDKKAERSERQGEVRKEQGVEDDDRLRSGESEKREKLKDAQADKAEVRAEQKENRELERQEKMNEREAKKEDRLQERQEKMNERMALYVTRTEERFNAIVARLETLGDRIDSRSQKFQERGVDTSEADSLLDSAYLSLSQAGETLRVAISELDTALTGDSPREDIEAAKALFGDVKQDLREAHQSFVASIKALKGASSEAKDDSSSDESEE